MSFLPGTPAEVTDAVAALRARLHKTAVEEADPPAEPDTRPCDYAEAHVVATHDASVCGWLAPDEEPATCGTCGGPVFYVFAKDTIECRTCPQP